MTEFQFDECINSRNLFNSCSAQGLATPIKFPPNLKGKTDDELLPDLLSKDCSFLTSDRRIVRQHFRSIPLQHPGIIMIANAPNLYPSLTDKTIFAILENFKKSFPQWCSVSWKNSIVKITQQSVEVSRIIVGVVEKQIKIYYNDPKFGELLEIALNSNAGS